MFKVIYCLVALVFIGCSTSPEPGPWNFKRPTVARCIETCEGERDMCYMMHDDITDCGAEFKKCIIEAGKYCK